MDRYNSTSWNNEDQELLLSFLLTDDYSNRTSEDELQHQSRIDFSIYDFPSNRLWWIRPSWECALKVGFFLPVMAVSIIGNGLVIYLMATNRSLRTSINIFIWNLATADLLTALFFPWIILVMDLYQMFLLGKFICEIECFLRVMLILVDVFSLKAISYDRFMSVAFPFRPKMGHCMAYIISGIIWVVAFSVAVPIVTARTYGERVWRNLVESWCSDNINFNVNYYLALDVIVVWIPFVVMAIFFPWMFFKLRQRSSTTSAVQLKQQIQRKRVAVMLLLILASFILCYTPFTIMIVVGTQINATAASGTIPSWVKSMHYVSRYLACVTTAINPVIYGYLNDNFRKALSKQFPRFKWGVGPISSSIIPASNNSDSSQQSHTNTTAVKDPMGLSTTSGSSTDISTNHI